MSWRDDGRLVKESRVGNAFQVEELPEIGDGASADSSQLVWAPLDAAGAQPSADPGRATYLRLWAAADMEEASLMELWKAGGDVTKAEAAMKARRAAGGDTGVAPERTLAEEADFGALLTSAIIEYRKDLVRARKAIIKTGTHITLKTLQRFYYVNFSRSSDAHALSTAMEQEAEADDGLDDHCAICGQRGLLVCCDLCSNVYHLACVRLTEVPEGDWKCPDCLNPPNRNRPQRAAAWTGPLKPIVMPGSRTPQDPSLHVHNFRGPRSNAPSAQERMPPAAAVAAPLPDPRLIVYDAATLGQMAEPQLRALARMRGIDVGSVVEKSQLVLLLLRAQAASVASGAELPSAGLHPGGEAKRKRVDAGLAGALPGSLAAPVPAVLADPHSTKRVFTNEKGQMYTQDIATGKTSWCSESVTMSIVATAVNAGAAGSRPAAAAVPAARPQQQPPSKG